MLTNIFRIAILAAPFVALVFYYTVLKQQQFDVEMQREEVKFEREWNEWKAQSPLSQDRKKYQERAEKSEEKLKELEEEEKERKRKVKKFEEEFEKALEESNKQKQ